MNEYNTSAEPPLLVMEGEVHFLALKLGDAGFKAC